MSSEQPSAMGERKIVKAKRRLDEKDQVIKDEDGQELSFEDEEWEDVDYMDDQEVVQDEDDEEMEFSDSKKAKDEKEE